MIVNPNATININGKGGSILKSTPPIWQPCMWVLCPTTLPDFSVLLLSDLRVLASRAAAGRRTPSQGCSSAWWYLCRTEQTSSACLTSILEHQVRGLTVLQQRSALQWPAQSRAAYWRSEEKKRRSWQTETLGCANKVMTEAKVTCVQLQALWGRSLRGNVCRSLRRLWTRRTTASLIFIRSWPEKWSSSSSSSSSSSMSIWGLHPKK